MAAISLTTGSPHLDYLRFITENRRFLAFGALLVGLSSVGQTFLISLFGGQLRDAFGLSNTSFGLLYSLATLASAVTLVWVGRMVDTVDLRRFTAVVLIAAAVGCALLAGSQNLVMLVLVLIVVMLPLALLLLRGHSHRQADYAQRQALAATAGLANDSLPGEVLRQPLFHALLPAVMAPPFIITALFFHQVPLAREQGWRLEWLASSFVAFAAAHVAALLLAGPLVDRVGARRIVPT